MANETPQNHGEGNPEAAEQFNDAEQRFVESPQGKRKIEQGPQVKPDEAPELEEAERRARERARGEDPGVHRGSESG